jgi:hypothetical protein
VYVSSVGALRVQERSELATEKAALADRIRVFKEESESAKLAVEDLQARLTKTEGKLAAAIVVSVCSAVRGGALWWVCLGLLIVGFRCERTQDKQQAIEDLTLRRVEQVEKLQAEFELQKVQHAMLPAGGASQHRDWVGAA